MEIAQLPTLNAVLNSIATVLLLCGWFNIRRRHIPAHRLCMLAAVVVSALFLVSYLVYHFHSPVNVFPGQGAVRVVYLLILVSHIVLAIVNVPLVVVTLWRALRGDFSRHRRIARWTLPIWLYVSVTGVVVYLMLYQLY
jgi:uncharacterized membrane protein YozB (DUF420 family)